MRLDALRLGAAFGIVCTAGVIVLTLGARFFGWGGAAVDVLESVYVGDATTWVGLVMGAVWGYAYGFIGGFLVGWVYNYLLPGAISNAKQTFQPDSNSGIQGLNVAQG